MDAREQVEVAETTYSRADNEYHTMHHVQLTPNPSLSFDLQYAFDSHSREGSFYSGTPLFFKFIGVHIHSLNVFVSTLTQTIIHTLDWGEF